MLIYDTAGANTALVKSNGSLFVKASDMANAGFITATTEHSTDADGDRFMNEMTIDPDYMVRGGFGTLLWYDQFNHNTLNTWRYQGTTSTMTMTMSGGFLNLNAGNALAQGNVVRFQTWRSFPVFGATPLSVNIRAGFMRDVQPGFMTEWGLGYAATTVTPTDGVFFRVTHAGAFMGVLNFGGQEICVPIDESYYPKAGVNYRFKITINQNVVEFGIDGIIVGRIFKPGNTGKTVFNSSLPLLLRHAVITNAPLLAQQFRVASLMVTLGTLDTKRQWFSVNAGMGHVSYNAPDGVALGTTANYANAAAPTSASVTVIAGGYTTLGGQWQYAAAVSKEVDLCAFAYQVPTGSAVVPGKNLVIRGIRIDTLNTGANNITTPCAIQWGMSVGASAITPATADSGTATTRAARRICLGMQGFQMMDPLASPGVGGTMKGWIGDQAQPIDVNFDAPLVCEPGTYVQVYYKPFLGAATASQIYRGTVMINGYWE
jgi:hypothetical protein